MRILQIVFMIIGIAVVLFLTIYISQDIIDTFSVLDNSASDKATVNKDMLKHSILLTDNTIKNNYEDDLILTLGTSKKNMMMNIIKYYDTCSWSEWISVFKDVSIIYNICQQVYYFIGKKIRKTSKVIYYRPNKYKYDSLLQNVLIDMDLVLSNSFLHINVVCIVNLESRQIFFLSIKAVGTINEDKIWQETNSIDGNNYVQTDAQIYVDNDDKQVMNLMYEDTCKSMKTQDDQVYNLLYSKLMYLPDRASLQNEEYMQYQNKIRHMFNYNLQKKCDRSVKKKLNNTYKNFPYNDDFVVRASL